MKGNPASTARSYTTAIGRWLYRLIITPGWSRWLLLAVAAFVFMLAALYISGMADYRRDPSALAPRSSELYVETRDLHTFFQSIGVWDIWHPNRRASGQESRNDFEKEMADLIRRKVDGLPLNFPLKWMAESSGAAWCVSSPEGEGETSWALYLRLEDTESVLRENEVETGLTLTPVSGTRDNGVFSLSGREGDGVFLGVLAPWLIISGDQKLIDFAFVAKRRPSLSLAGTGILPRWRRGVDIRALIDPAYAARSFKEPGTAFAAGWLAPEARLAVSARLGRRGGVETSMAFETLGERAGGGGLWPLFVFLLWAAALLSLLLIVIIILVMVGWGGWFKLLAVRAGIAPAAGPKTVEPSEAFKRDSGLEAAPQPDAGEPSPPVAATEPEAIDNVVSVSADPGFIVETSHPPEAKPAESADDKKEPETADEGNIDIIVSVDNHDDSEAATGDSESASHPHSEENVTGSEDDNPDSIKNDS